MSHDPQKGRTRSVIFISIIEDVIRTDRQVSLSKELFSIQKPPKISICSQTEGLSLSPNSQEYSQMAQRTSFQSMVSNNREYDHEVPVAPQYTSAAASSQ